MSIKKSLQSSMVLAAGIPIIIFAILTILISIQNSRTIAKEAIRATAENYQNGFEAQLNTQIIEIEGLANDNDIQNALLQKYNDPEFDLTKDVASSSLICEALKQTSNSFASHVIYSVFDTEGVLIYSSSPELIGSYSHYVEDMSATLEQTQVNSTVTLNNMSNAIHIMTPIMIQDNRCDGVMVASIAPEYFGRFISSETNTYLLDNASNGLLNVAFPDETIRRKAVYQLIHYDGNPENRSGTVELQDGFSYIIYGYSIMPKYHWIYLVEQDMQIYQTLIRAILILFIIVAIVLLLVTTIVSSRLAKNYCNPILDLKDKMLQASQGNLDVRSETKSQDEFGDLSTHFNDMMQIISVNYKDLKDARLQLENSQAELKTNYDQIEQLAYTDTLTGLANRVSFMTQAHDIFHQSGGFIRRAILFIDLDNFKNVNDTLGHDYGDLLLQQIAIQLSSHIADGDLLARTGGDEFLILRKQVATTEELDRFAAELISIADHPFDLNGENVHVSMSVGVAIFPQNGLTITELIKNADIAMYSAKAAGKSGYQFFNSSMEDELNHRNEIEEVLHSAIQNREIYLVYQPQCDMKTGRITGCEALMRLRNGYLGQIPPTEFIPIAEESGIINQLGAWALEHACDFNKQLIDAGYGPITMSVNVSIQQLKNPNFIPELKAILERTGLEPQYLEIEVTESVLMQSLDYEVSLLQKMRDMGIRIALDDFGTGYSSFNYLTKIPITTLKMDKSFVDNISTNSKDCFVAETIISLAHKLNIAVVAEGVETSDQLRILQENSCDILQGYLFSKPIPDEYYRNLLEINNS